MTDTLLAHIVARLDRANVPNARFPDRKSEYWAHCPFHADKHATNFSVSAAGYRCFACGAKGGLRALAEKLGVPSGLPDRLHGCTVERGVQGYSLEHYGKDKALPLDFLKGLGLSDRKLNGRPAVRIPYYDALGRERLVRYRIAATYDKFRWSKGAKVMPYGLERLDRARGYVYLVEGESDAQTLWLHGEPTLGLIQAHALLHQATRPRDHQGRIVATLQDYAAVCELVIDIILEGVPAAVRPEVREVVAAVRELDKPNAAPVTFKRVGEHLGLDKSAAKRRCEVALSE